VVPTIKDNKMKYITILLLLICVVSLQAQKNTYPVEGESAVTYTYVLGNQDTISNKLGYGQYITTVDNQIANKQLRKIVVSTASNVNDTLYLSVYSKDVDSEYEPQLIVINPFVITEGSNSATYIIDTSFVQFELGDRLFLSVENGRNLNAPDYIAGEGDNTISVDFYFDNVGLLDTDILTLEQQIMALSGIVSYWPLTESSGTTASNLVNASLNGTYAGGISLATSDFPKSEPVVKFTDANDGITMPIGSISSAWNWNKGWLMLWVKTDTTLTYDNTTSIAFQIASTLGGTFTLTETDPTQKGLHTVRYQRAEGANIDYTFSKNSEANWDLIVYNWDATIDTMEMYHNGNLMYSSGKFGATVPTDIISFSLGQVISWFGGIGHVAFGAGENITQKQINKIWQYVYPTRKQIFACGDSKAANENDYYIELIADYLTVRGGEIWQENPYRIGVGGYKVDQVYDLLADRLPDIDTLEVMPDFILVSGGANDLAQIEDIVGTPSCDSLCFSIRVTNTLDLLHDKFPSAKIFWTKPYRDDFSDGRYDLAALAMARWIDEIIALPKYSNFFFSGPNENLWFKPNIATYSDDRVHYNNAGHQAALEEWKTVLSTH
jgi:lysophospholipase L1-like esterase